MEFCLDVCLPKLQEKAKSYDMVSTSDQENIAISPFGICVILNIITNGAKGDTLQQLLQFLKLRSVDDLVSQANQLMQIGKSSKHNENPVICNFNAVLVKESISLNKNHQDYLENVFKAKLKHVDFLRKNEAVDEVNEWIKQETNGYIEKFFLDGAFDQKNESSMVIHANGLYFNGKWEDEFLESNTKREKFYLLDHNKMVKAPFMKDYGRSCLYGTFDEYDVLKVPYKINKNINYKSSRTFSMIIILPKERLGLPNLAQKFRDNPNLLSRRHLVLKQEEIARLWIPKFKFMYGFTPSEEMKELGLTLPFTENNDEFTCIVEGGVRRNVSKILQRTQIECYESGTEVICCTEDSDTDVGFSVYTRPVINFIADHPFMFVIKEDVRDTIFFLGAIFNPLNNDTNEDNDESDEEDVPNMTSTTFHEFEDGESDEDLLSLFD